jgi:hypothetical protein
MNAADRDRRAAAAYAAGDLDAAQRALARARIDDDPAFAREVAAMGAVVELLGEVPGAAWTAIAAPPAARRRRPASERRMRALAGAMACLAVGVAVGLVAGRGPSIDGVRTHGSGLVLHALPGADATDRAVAYIPDRDHMLLHVIHLPRPAPGTFYEAWLLTDTHHLAPIVAFRVDHKGRAALVLRLPDDPHRYRYIDISVQRVDGGAGHSGDSVLRTRLV